MQRLLERARAAALALRLFRANYSCGICARTPWRMPQNRVVRTRRPRASGTGLLARNKRRASAARCRAGGARSPALKMQRLPLPGTIESPTGIALGLTGVCHKVWQRLLSAARGIALRFTGQLFLWDSRANALVHVSISRRTNKAAARACHRRYWPETNVGASAAAIAARAALDLTGAEDAPATLARNHRISHRRCGKHLSALMRSCGAGLPAIGQQS